MLSLNTAIYAVSSPISYRSSLEAIELSQRYTTLSEREREVMAHVAGGALNKQVGAVLGISQVTVKVHRGRVMRKMGANSLAELVMMALLLHLILPRLDRRG